MSIEPVMVKGIRVIEQNQVVMDWQDLPGGLQNVGRVSGVERPRRCQSGSHKHVVHPNGLCTREQKYF